MVGQGEKEGLLFFLYSKKCLDLFWRGESEEIFVLFICEIMASSYVTQSKSLWPSFQTKCSMASSITISLILMPIPPPLFSLCPWAPWPFGALSRARNRVRRTVARIDLVRPGSPPECRSRSLLVSFVSSSLSVSLWLSPRHLKPQLPAPTMQTLPTPCSPLTQSPSP